MLAIEEEERTTINNVNIQISRVQKGSSFSNLNGSKNYKNSTFSNGFQSTSATVPLKSNYTIAQSNYLANQVPTNSGPANGGQENYYSHASINNYDPSQVYYQSQNPAPQNAQSHYYPTHAEPEIDQRGGTRQFANLPQQEVYQNTLNFVRQPQFTSSGHYPKTVTDQNSNKNYTNPINQPHQQYQSSHYGSGNNGAQYAQ